MEKISDFYSELAWFRCQDRDSPSLKPNVLGGVETRSEVCAHNILSLLACTSIGTCMYYEWMNEWMNETFILLSCTTFLNENDEIEK